MFGYETPKSNEVIDSLVKSIRLGIKLPLFHVFEFEKGKYSLSPKEKIIINGKEFTDGGHHRAIAYFKEKIIFSVIKIDKPGIPIHMIQRGYLNIKNIPLLDNYSEYLKRKDRYGNYL